MTIMLKRPAGVPFEVKSAADDDDLADQIAGLAADVKKAQGDLEAKVAKMIADAVKPLADAQLDVEKKAGRPKIGGSSIEVKGDPGLESKAIRTFLSSGARSFDPARHLTADEIKAMTVGSDPDGGFTVFPVLSAGVTKRMFDQSPMRRLSRVETITEGDSWEEPIDHDDVGAEWVGETEARPETSSPQVGMLNVPVHEIYAMPKVSQRMIDDSSWDIAKWLEGKIGDKFGRSEGYAALLGNGIRKPRGILTYPTDTTADLARPWGTIQHVVSGHATTVTADSLRTIVWALRAPYRIGASWIMNSNTAGAIDQFKDLNGQYIWRNGLTEGAKSTLLGYPVEIDENMPDVAAGSVPIMFGNMRIAYVIVDKAGYKLLQDPYTAKPHVLFYTYRRTGGGLSNSEAVKFLKVGT